MMSGLDICYADASASADAAVGPEVAAAAAGASTTRASSAAASAAAADPHPLVGRRMPDLDLVTVGGVQRVYHLLHAARPILVNFSDPGAFDLTGWSDRVRLVEAQPTADTWELPVLGHVPAPPAVLVRPDGYVAWTGGPDLAGVLTTWFGSPR